MKKHRLPYDIEFLLESILDESPDRVDLEGEDSGGTKNSDPTRLNSLGAEVPKTGGTFRWKADDAYAFFFDDENGVVMYTTQNTHTDMEDTLQKAANKATAYPSTFKNMYEVKRDSFGNITAMSYKEKEEWAEYAVTVGFIGLPEKGNDSDTVRDYLHTNRVYFRRLDIRGGGDEANVPAGRIWIKKNVISFWNGEQKILKLFPLVEKLMNGFKVNKTKFAYEFLDHRGLFAYKELTGDNTREKLSPEEMKKLMAIQHLDPKAKEKLAGTDFREKHLKKAAKGFDFPAQASAAMPALEEELISEDPDGVYLNKDGREQRLVHYTDDDAAAFMTFPTFSVLSVGGVHFEIKKFLASVYIRVTSGEKLSKEDVVEMIGDENMEISDIESMLKDLGGRGACAKAFEQGIFATPTQYRYKIKNGLSGRLWPDSNIIAFWNKKSDVLDNWGQVVQLFKDNYGYGSVDQYDIDFLERATKDFVEPLTPGEQVSKSVSGQSQPQAADKNQLDFFGKLLAKPDNLDKLSDAQLEKLAGKLHLMTPAQKNKVMKAAGMNYNKAAEIANKMGLSVVEFHHLMQVTEERIPSLQEIVSKIRNRK